MIAGVGGDEETTASDRIFVRSILSTWSSQSAQTLKSMAQSLRTGALGQSAFFKRNSTIPKTTR